MTSLEQPILISFKLCPFVQRAVITLLHKKIDYTIEYIDLQKKPDWFLEISPLGKVPLLRVKDHVLFESAVINEYLDETHGEPMLSKDPLEKAEQRAWIEFSSSLFNAQHQLTQARREETYFKIEEDLTKKLAPLERKIGNDGFFEGKEFTPKLHYVKIMFNTPKFEKITKDRAAKFVDMISAIGGTVGLLTGFSVISGVEIIYYAARIMLNYCKTLIKK